ncbi:hypothetical protein ES708_06664 [subsurface metagenome]
MFVCNVDKIVTLWTDTKYYKFKAFILDEVPIF